MDKKFLWLISAAVIIVSFILIEKRFGKDEFVALKIGNTTIQVELADTPEKRVKGLSGRDKLGEDEGMLFAFEEFGHHGIWMKDMKFPIDIIWAGLNMRIVDIADNISPDTYPQVFRPKEPAYYVLEVNAGFVKKYGIKIGDTIQKK